MLLITITRLPHGYRLVATSTWRADYYCWSLYRDGTLLAVISRNYSGENSINFDLRTPLVPGYYELRVECFAWDATTSTTTQGYQTTTATIQLE